MSETWHASAGLFSGRPDPSWVLDLAAAQAFRERWNALPTDPRQPTWHAPRLGYRGCRIWSERTEWRLYASRAQRLDAGNPIEWRHDPGGRLERWLLGTAPPSLRQLVLAAFDQ